MERKKATQGVAFFLRVKKDSRYLFFAGLELPRHPSLAHAGSEANFESDDVEYRLGAMTHEIDDYSAAMTGAGFEIRETHVIDGSEELGRAIPAAAKYVGAPLLVVFTGRRAA